MSIELGVVLPNFGPHASRDGVLRVAEAAEELDFSSVWTTEHILVGKDIAEDYGNVLEPFACLAFVAARLERIGFGTSIVLIPLHHPAWLAKEAATLQLLSGERLRLGIGVGWYDPEFRFLGVEFGDRGRRADEALRLMQALWAGESSFEGDYWSFDEVHFGPLPDQPPELWIGGASKRSLRRARELGAVWHPNVAQTDLVREAKRSWPEGRVVPRVRLGFSSRDRTPLDDPTEIAAGLEELLDAGIDGAILGFGSDPAEIVPGMRTFAREVRPRLAGRL